MSCDISVTFDRQNEINSSTSSRMTHTRLLAATLTFEKKKKKVLAEISVKYRDVFQWRAAKAAFGVRHKPGITLNSSPGSGSCYSPSVCVRAHTEQIEELLKDEKAPHKDLIP